MLENITWLGQSGFKIITKSGKTIYIDPWKISGDSSEADYILITHEHFDHCSPEDIAKIRKEKTKIFCPHECIQKIGGQAKSVKPGKEIKEEEITIKTVPAYNIDKEYHPKENNWVGYVIEADGQKMYHAGDTDLIPEMDELENIDIAMLPVSGTYVMDSQEAAQAIARIKPKKIIPMHYGEVVGSSEDARKLKEKYPKRVEIMEKE
ncbi:MAG: MBL fold metallo-hydrolase [Patescibacteria group bacterium]|nr:MBL fold metallo-hydrolase [Patescibacteria group bacterium]